jgi:hypothetical protein
MRKFSHQVLLNESRGNTFTMGKSVDNMPEEWDDILDLFQLFGESYGDVISTSIGAGWVNPTELSGMTRVGGLAIISNKKIKSYLQIPSGQIPDKWKACVKMMIKWSPIECEWVSSKKGDWVKASTEVWQEGELDKIISRINSIKTLSKRLERWCDVYYTPINHGFMGGETGESMAVVAILKDDLWA